MPQIFHPSTNSISRISILAILIGLGGLAWAGSMLTGSGVTTGQGLVLDQPVPFSHDHHFAGLGIQCGYCHTSVEKSSFAGIPPIETCMNCHRQVWTNAALLEPIREAWRTGVPIEWERVNDLPDFVYFNHSIHVAKGIGCETCHGRVDQMPLMRQAQPLTMQWCLDCHNDPAKYVRPRDEVYTFGWRPPVPQSELGPRLVEEYGIKSQLSCSVCHR
jgi:hypothetical protein